MSWLDNNGVSYLWGKMKAWVQNQGYATSSSLLNAIYPVGSIYMSVNNTDPSLLFGGTWEAWGSGQVPVGVNTNDTDFNTVEKTGGSKSHSYTPAGTNSAPTFTGTKATLSHTGGAVQKHTLTTSEIPAHRHNGIATDIGGTTYGLRYAVRDYNTGTPAQAGINLNSGNTFYTANAGGGGAHNHGFTQPTAHSFTPAGTNSKPTFTGTASTQSHLQPYITCYMWKRVA